MLALKVQIHEPGKRLVLSSGSMGPTIVFLISIFLLYVCIGLFLFFGSQDASWTGKFLVLLIIPIIVALFVSRNRVVTIDGVRREITDRLTFLGWTLRYEKILFADLDKITLASYRVSSGVGDVTDLPGVVGVAAIAIHLLWKPTAWAVNAVSRNGKGLTLWTGADQTQVLDLAQKVVAITGVQLEVRTAKTASTLDKLSR